MESLIPKASSLFVLILGSIGGTALIKWLLEQGAAFMSGEAKKLSHLPSLILGYVVSLAFVVAAQAGIIPLPESLQAQLTQFQTALMPLLAKAIYDTVNDLAKKGKPKT